MTLTKCTQRDERGVLCWGVAATRDGSRTLLPCGHTETQAEVATVVSTYSAALPCDGSCVYGRGASCECSCGGSNHGIGWITPPRPLGDGAFDSTDAQARDLDDPAWRSWLMEEGRRDAIDRIVARHQAARHAAEDRNALVRLRRSPITLSNALVIAAQLPANLLARGIADGVRAAWKAEREDRDAERARRMAASRFVGTEGEKLTATLTLIFVREISSQYGMSYLHGLEDVSGNQIRWFASGRSPWEIEVPAKAGAHDCGYAEQRYHHDAAPSVCQVCTKARYGFGAIMVTGTVKKHEEYEGCQQTFLIRIKEAK